MLTVLDMKMVPVYADRVEREELTLEDVPRRIRRLVAELIDERAGGNSGEVVS